MLNWWPSGKSKVSSVRVPRLPIVKPTHARFVAKRNNVRETEHCVSAPHRYLDRHSPWSRPGAVMVLQPGRSLSAASGFTVMELIKDTPSAQHVRKALKLVSPFVTVWPTEAECNRALADFAAYHLSHGLGLLDASDCRARHKAARRHYALSMSSTTQPFLESRQSNHIRGRRRVSQPAIQPPPPPHKGQCAILDTYRACGVAIGTVRH